MDLAHCTTTDGIRLDGLWSSAVGKPVWAFDTVIMLHGVTGNFYATDFFNAAVKILIDGGVSVLRVNNRGHDVVNRVTSADGVRFMGAAFEDIADAKHDCRAWIDFAVRRGAKRVALWGHSLGAVKAIFYAGRGTDPRVACAVASSPPRFSYAEFQKDPIEWPIFQSHYREAKGLVEAGTPEALIRISKPTALVISAGTFMEKYGPDGGFDYLEVATNIDVPLLLTIGSQEGVEARPGFSRLALFGSQDYLKALESRNAKVRNVMIDGADHWYAGCEYAVTDAVTDFFATI